MPVEILRQVNFTNGELDPLVARRRDIQAYTASSQQLSDVLVHPQGPISRRYGMAFCGKVRLPLTAVSLAAATITAPNGGDTTKVAADADGALVTTTALGVTNPYVVCEIDFAAPTAVGMVDLIDYAAKDPVTDAKAPPAGYPWGTQGPRGTEILP